jgi:hypothetical protein
MLVYVCSCSSPVCLSVQAEACVHSLHMVYIYVYTEHLCMYLFDTLLIRSTVVFHSYIYRILVVSGLIKANTI